MKNEFRLRPFVRPLWWWITGITLEVCFPFDGMAVWLWLPVAAVISGSWFFARRTAPPQFDGRWIWGGLMAYILILTAMQATEWTMLRLSFPQEPNWLERQARLLQSLMVEKLDLLNLTGDEKSLLATITVNYRSGLTQTMREQFSTVGMSHLLSISGFHVGIVGGFLSFAFSFLPRFTLMRWLRLALILTMIWTYAFVCGLAPSAVRAAVMLSLYQLSTATKYRSDKYNVLAAAAFCMLAWNPLNLFNIGFQLSFVGTFFIMYLQPRFTRIIHVRNLLLKYAWNILTVTLSAQIGVFGLCCYYFGMTSTIGIIANLYLCVLSLALIPLTLLWMAFPLGALPGSVFLQRTIELLTSSIVWLVDRFSRVPGATFTIDFDFISLLSFYGVLFAAIYYFRTRYRPLLFAAVIMILLMIARPLIFA